MVTTLDNKLEQLQKRAQALPTADRVALAERLFESLEAEGVTAARKLEADAGIGELIQWEEALAKLRGLR